MIRMVPPVGVQSMSISGLLDRRVIGRVHEHRHDATDDPAVDLRFRRHLLPFRIGLEVGSALFRGLTAVVRNDVDERVVLGGRILRHPVTDVFMWCLLKMRMV